VGVVDENLLEVRVDLAKPASVGGGLEVKHAKDL
jgi:hypothetical protein